MIREIMDIVYLKGDSKECIITEICKSKRGIEYKVWEPLTNSSARFEDWQVVNEPTTIGFKP